MGLQQASLRLSETPRSRHSPRNGTPVGSYRSSSRRVSTANRPVGASSPARFVEGFKVPADVNPGSPSSNNANTTQTVGTTTAAFANLGTSLLSGTPRSVSRAGGPFEAPVGQEDLEVVDRHLDPNAEDDEFRSLQLQGGDVHRQVYQWSQQQKQAQQARRSQSFYLPRPAPEDESTRNLKVPGGFRRNYIAQQHNNGNPNNDSNSIGSRRQSMGYGGVRGNSNGVDEDGDDGAARSPFLTRNFIEFLSLYGHFAGMDLEEEEEEDDSEQDGTIDAAEEAGNVADTEPDQDDDRPHERRPLLTPRKSTRRRAGIRMDERGDASVTKAVLLLLKSFVGTGVLFLPKAFLNGGMLFSSLVLLGVSAISLYCFLLLVNTRLVINASFGDIGGHLYGKHMRSAILTSIAVSQIGFVCAYTAFTAENLGAFIRAVTDGATEWSMASLIAIQLVLFLPLSMIRDIGKLSFTALIADFFILLGLVYLYYADISHILDRGGLADIVLFNERDWTLFIGTAIFTFEGIGLIIPITQAMREPEKFPAALGGVMLFITVLFTSIGALSYAAFGSHTKTVILSNLPQSNRFVNAVQLLYSLAILLSTPLQLFPAIRILETGYFAARSGKFSRRTKWSKNLFRVGLVLVASLIAYVGADDLDKFVSLIGSFACVPLVFVYPPLLHMKACRTTRRGRIADLALAGFGVLAMIYTTVTSIKSWVAT